MKCRGLPLRRLESMMATLVIVVVAACAPVDDRHDWPQWRGEGSYGVSDVTPLPARWSADSSNIRWRTELPGVGNSSPIVAGDRIYLTAAYAVDEDAEAGAGDEAGGDGPSGRGAIRHRAVLGLDRVSGELLWTRPLFAAAAEAKHRTNTLAAPTPVSDGEDVFVYFGSTLARLDPQGEILWQHEIDPEYRRLTRYGAASSPVLTEDAVIVLQDKEYAKTEDIGWLAAYARQTGELIWRNEWEDTCCTYTTPLVVDRGAGEEILVAHSGVVISYAAESGETLWSHQVEILQMVGTPILAGDLLLVAGGAHNVKATYGLRLAGAGAVTTVEELWESRKAAPQNASPVLYRDQLYTVTDQGIVASYRAESGEMVFHHRLDQGRNRASLVAGDGKVYAISTGGTVAVIAAGESFELLGENHLGEPGNNASPAIADGCLLLRTRRHLVCVEAEGGRVDES